MRVDAGTDGDLLAGFVRTGDEAPFAEVVRRHQDMVLGTCRRVTRDAALAEDAAQAVFLVLARKASGLRGRLSVGGWLHRVARNLSLVAVRGERRRRRREQETVAMMSAQQETFEQREALIGRLDEMLNRLPEKYRVPLILHHFEGLSERQAAERLGLKLGTLSVRLNRGRELLRRRLSAVIPSLSGSVLLAYLGKEPLAEAAAEGLPTATARVAQAVMKDGLRQADGSVSAQAIAISGEGLKMMLYRNLAVVGTASALALTCVGSGAWLGLERKPSSSELAEASPTLGVKKIGESVIAPEALIHVPSPTSVYANGMTHQQDGLATFNGHQYAAYYDSARRLCVARRRLPNGDWEGVHFDDWRPRGQVPVNVAVLGICPRNGTIHLAFDSHESALRYRVSGRGVATRPREHKWTAGLFGPVTSKLDNEGEAFDRLAFPRFLTTPKGNLQMFWRHGVYGDGDCMLAEYDGDSGAWKVLGAVTTRAGSYGKSRSRNAYLNGMDYGPAGRLHLSWCWREAGDSTNHDLCYAFSNDDGRIWHNSAGKRVGETETTPLHPKTPGVNVWKIGVNRGYLNTNGQAVDGKGRLHAVISHMPPGFPDERDWRKARRQSRYYHYWRDVKGTWNRNLVSVKRASRPKLRFDARDTLYLVCRSAQIALASAANQWSGWRIVHVEDGVFFGEPVLDPYRWSHEGILSLYAQRRPQSGEASSPLCVLDFRPAGPRDAVRKR